ncbi:hypothetical protein FPRO04_14407 [Fusarium proliferatum]|nr:hypothetical protein FPRO04_14407 [Fusarium proliferatum]
MLLIPHFMTSKRHNWAAKLIFVILSIVFLYYKANLSKPLTDHTDTDWSRFAYAQYVTNSEYLCNSVMLFEALQHLPSRADRIMIYPSHMLGLDYTSSDARLLVKARDKYNVKLIPITVRHKDNADEKEILSTMVMLIEPSEVEFARIMSKMDSASSSDYDMEIINSLYRNNALVLPHRHYALLTGEFRSESHAKYLGSDVEPWDPARAYNEAKLVHFSDWPFPKPWLHTNEELRLKLQLKCMNAGGGAVDCTARIIWNSFYTDFQKKRKEICS